MSTRTGRYFYNALISPKWSYIKLMPQLLRVVITCPLHNKQDDGNIGVLDLFLLIWRHFWLEIFEMNGYLYISISCIRHTLILRLKCDEKGVPYTHKYTDGNVDFNSLYFFIIKHVISNEFITHTPNMITIYVFPRLLFCYTFTFIQR